MANFQIAVNLVLAQEGAVVDSPGDPGGLTNWGISQRAYPNLNIAQLTRAEATAIYLRDYWLGDKLNDQRLANLLLSMSVNMGKAGAVRLLQQACGTVPDGTWGPLTEHLANARADTLIDFSAFCARRYFSMAQGVEEIYLMGWLRRIFECLV